MENTNILEKLRNLKYSWEVKGNKITYKKDGAKRDVDAMKDALEAIDNTISITDLESLIKDEVVKTNEENPTGVVIYTDLPRREADLTSQCDLTKADIYVWAGLRFTDDFKTFYVKDAKDRNTYTAFLTSASSADKADAKMLKEAFCNNIDYDPVFRAKQMLNKCGNIKPEDLDQIADELPTTASSFYQLKGHKVSQDTTIWTKIVITRGRDDKLYDEFIKYENQFRRLKSFRIDPPANLTNNKNESAIAYIDLEALDKKYKDKSSELWDTFLLQRLHSEDYVSIFKAWSYAVIVGKNNSRQEMWLYGNGGTGKSCLCKSFIKGINKLTGKDICLAASKDTGKSTFNSELLNKHLLVYADAKNLKGGMSEFKHNVTGGDAMRIEGKCKEATYGEVYLKCLTCSNELPKVDTADRSQSSRYIILPFSLTDEELKKYGLMDENNQLIGSADFQSQLDNEFELFLASCKEHYLKRCKTNSNIDAHEASKYLESISTTEIEMINEFINEYFEITTDVTDKITLKDFRMQYAKGVADVDEDTCVKLYKDIKLDDVYSYLERKYGFIRTHIRIEGHTTTPRGLTSKTCGIKIKKTADSAEHSTSLELLE